MLAKCSWAAVFAGGLVFCCVVSADEPAAKKSKTHGDKAAQTAALSGRLVDEDGSPVTGAKLRVAGQGVYHTTKSDHNGDYWFHDVEKAGVYRLRIESTRCVGFTDYADQKELTLAPGKPLVKNFTLPRASRLNIKVVDEAGEPVQAVINYCCTKNPCRMRSVRLGRAGSATLGGFPPGTEKHQIAVSAEGYAIGYAMASVEDPKLIDELTVVLKRGKTIRGIAVCADGEPAVGWQVAARPTWLKVAVDFPEVVIADDGAFEVPNVGEGNYDVSVLIIKNLEVSRQYKVLAETNLSQLKTPVRIKVDHPSPASMKHLACNIRWIGKPIERGFELTGYCADSRYHTSEFVPSDAKTVKFGPMPPGIYQVQVRNSKIEVMNRRGIKNLDDLSQVKVPSDEPIQIVLRAIEKPRLQGRVFDRMTKEPIRAFRYRVSKVKTLRGPNTGIGNDWHSVSDADGSFQVEVPGPGVYFVQILADNYALEKSIEVNTDESPDVRLELGLQRGHSLAGQVVDTDGEGIKNARVRLRSLTSGSYGNGNSQFTADIRAVTTNESGEFILSNVPTGHDYVRVDHDDFLFKTAYVNFSEDSQPLKFALLKGASIRGTVFGDDGIVAAKEPLFFHKEKSFSGRVDGEAAALAEVTTDERGGFAAHHLPAGMVYLSRYQPWSTQGVVRHAVRVEEGGEHHIQLGGRSKLTGKCLVDDQAVASTRLQISGEDSSFGIMKQYGKTEPDGTFEFRGTPPGDWVLYREIAGARGTWVKVQDFQMPANVDHHLGTISQPTGTLTVECTTHAAALPKILKADLQQHRDLYSYGRTAAKMIARQDRTDPFVFTKVTPGDYDLEVIGGAWVVRKRLQIAKDALDQTVELKLPSGKATVRVKLLDRNGNPSVATVFLWTADGLMHSQMKPVKRKDGTTIHEAAEVADGKYVLRTWAIRADRPGIAELNVVDGQDVTVDAKLQSNYFNDNVTFRVFDQQGVFVRGKVKVTAGDERIFQQGDSFAATKLLVPNKATFTARIDIPGFEPFERQFSELTGGNSVDVIMKRPSVVD